MILEAVVQYLNEKGHDFLIYRNFLIYRKFRENDFRYARDRLTRTYLIQSTHYLRIGLCHGQDWVKEEYTVDLAEPNSLEEIHLTLKHATRVAQAHTP